LSHVITKANEPLTDKSGSSEINPVGQTREGVHTREERAQQKSS